MYCVVGKIGACHRGYIVTGGTRAGCRCHGSLDDGFCVRLERSDAGSMKRWTLSVM